MLPIINGDTHIDTLRQLMINDGYTPNDDDDGYYIDVTQPNFCFQPNGKRNFSLSVLFKAFDLMNGNYYDKSGFQTNNHLGNPTLNESLGLMNLVRRNYVKLIKENDPLYVSIPTEIMNQLHPIDMNIKHDGLSMYFVVVDIIDSDEYKTVISPIDSKDRFTINTKVANKLFNLIDKADYYVFNHSEHKSLTPYTDYKHRWLYNSLEYTLSFSAKWKVFVGYHFTCDFSTLDCAKRYYYDGFIYRNKKYQMNKTDGIFINAEGNIIFIETDGLLNISRVELYEIEMMNVEVIEPEEPEPIPLPGVCLTKSDNGFFDDNVIEVEVK